MADSDALHQRGKALEEQFFRRIDDKLQTALRQKMQREDERKRLATATGFQDQALLDHLLDAGFESSTIATMALVPMVFVAWADGSVTPQERQTVLEAASTQGTAGDSTASAVLTGWLQERPPQSLWDLWKEYFQAVGTTLAPARAETLRNEILRMATDVAKASGGTLGFGKISSAEQSILSQIERIVPSSPS